MKNSSYTLLGGFSGKRAVGERIDSHTPISELIHFRSIRESKIQQMQKRVAMGMSLFGDDSEEIIEKSEKK